MHSIGFNTRLAAFAVFVLTAVTAGCGGTTVAPNAKGDQHGDRHAEYIVTAQATGVLLGVQANPNGYPYSQQEPELASLEQYLGRTLALHHVYRDWSGLVGNLSQDPEIGPDALAGRVDVIAMNCGDDLPGGKTHLMDIVGGSDDQDLISIRTAITNLNYPVMLRWFWEFNQNASFPTKDPNNNNGCFQTPNPEAAPTAIPSLQTQFIEAYIHVRSVLTGGLPPIPNITFIWNPSAVPDGNYVPGPVQDIWDYYPGDKYVDWISFDGYSTVDNNNDALSFDSIFKSDIQAAEMSHPSVPVMIGETGACNNYPYSNLTGWQQTYLQSVQTELDNGAYPNVRALLYFDAPGQYTFPVGGTCDWSLPTNSGGITQFQTIAKDGNFTGMITPNNP